MLSLLDALKRLRHADKQMHCKEGICTTIQAYIWFSLPTVVAGDCGGNMPSSEIEHVSNTGSQLSKLMRTWPLYSGNMVFPIPPTANWVRKPNTQYEFEDRAPGIAFTIARDSGTMWSGPYGDLRMALLEFCIHELENANGPG